MKLDRSDPLRKAGLQTSEGGPLSGSVQLEI